MINKVKKLIAHPLFSGSLVMMAGSMGVNVVNYVYHLLMGRILGPVDYGVLASVFSILYIIGIVPQSGGVAIVKFISSAKSDTELKYVYHGIKRYIFKFSIWLSVFTLLISPLITQFLKIENYYTVPVVAFILFMILITLVNQAASQGRLNFIGFVTPNFVSAVGKLALGLLFVYLGLSVFGAVVAIGISAFLTYLVSRYFNRDLLREKKYKEFDIHLFLKYAGPVLIQALAFTSLFTTDLILVKHFLSPLEAGLYAALSTLGKIIFFAVSPITSAMFPIISGRKARGEGYRKVFLLALMSTAAISIGIIFVYKFFPDIAIGMLYGKAYLLAKNELFWMGLFMFFYTISYVLVNFMLSIGKTKIVYLPLVAAVAQIILISLFHNNIMQIIQTLVYISIILSLSLFTYLLYNRLAKDENK
jgi:O-antigen/teichoic acid export membrane protein